MRKLSLRLRGLLRPHLILIVVVLAAELGSGARKESRLGVGCVRTAGSGSLLVSWLVSHWDSRSVTCTRNPAVSLLLVTRLFKVALSNTGHLN